MTNRAASMSESLTANFRTDLPQTPIRPGDLVTVNGVIVTVVPG